MDIGRWALSEMCSLKMRHAYRPIQPKEKYEHENIQITQIVFLAPWSNSLIAEDAKPRRRQGS
jgi:hypothetical protein